MVCAFSGWNDAGEAASTAVSFINDRFESSEVARIDPEEFYDFTAVRPTVRLSEGLTREIDWPLNTVWAAPVPGADGDLVTLRGRRALAALAALHRQHRERGPGARRADGDHASARCSPTCRTRARWGSPASRPTSRSSRGSATSAPATRDRRGSWACCITPSPRAGLASASLWASVPHYVAAAPNPKVALALVRAFEGTAGVVVDATELEQAAEDYERQVTAAVASDPEVKAFVERLESADGRGAGATERPEERLPSADTIASDFQRFLRQRGPDPE